MQDTNDLKNIVIQGLESKGALSSIRAQIRASVFKSIEDENTDPASKRMENSFNWENKQAMQIVETETGLIMCKLFENFLQFYDLDYTFNIFIHEVNTSRKTDVDELS